MEGVNLVLSIDDIIVGDRASGHVALWPVVVDYVN